KLVMPGVKDVWSYGETGYHALTAAVVRERYERELMASAFRLLGEGQLSLTKFLLVTDQELDLRDFHSLLPEVLGRVDWRRDLYVFNRLSMDSLDYAGPRINHGSKAVLVASGPKVRELPQELPKVAHPLVRRLDAFCAGCLVVESSSHAEAPHAAQT